MSYSDDSECILAFESSCDETAVAAVDRYGRIVSQALASQIFIHRKFGGVVPEVASRSHFEKIDHLAQTVLQECHDQSVKITGVAATTAPGLIGPLLVGASYAQGLASGLGLEFQGVHHLRGHLASVLLFDESENSNTIDKLNLNERAQELFPSLVLLVSGGHTQILWVDPELRVQPVLDTSDDAAGECFDKSAKLMGLPYPGGPEIEKRARMAEETQLELAKKLSAELPRPKSQGGHFSFSGLKTAIRIKLEKQPELLKDDPAFCWAVEDAIAQTLEQGLTRSLKKLPAELKAQSKNLVFCGGVSANKKIRKTLDDWAQRNRLRLKVPPLRYCTDNAAMIAAAAWTQSNESRLHTVQARLPLGA